MTLCYVAPEIFNRTAIRPSSMTDIYLWSVRYYEFLCGTPSAWFNVLTVMNNALLMQAVFRNERSNIYMILVEIINIF